MSAAPYQVTFSASAQRDLRRLPEKIATAAVEFIYGSLARNPSIALTPGALELAQSE